MFNLTKFSDLLNNLDNAAKETLEEPKESATSLRLLKKKSSSSSDDLSEVDVDQVSSKSNINEKSQNDSSNIAPSDTSIATASPRLSTASAPVSTGTVNSSFKNNSSIESSTEVNQNNNAASIALAEKESSHTTSSKDFDTANITSNINSSISHQTRQSILPPSQQSQPPQQQSQDVKQLLKIKNKEIEKLNSEIIELEETCQSMKLEVQEAWNSYKTSQEKAMFRESELQEEIRLLQKAKNTDKQQIQIQLTQMNTEVTELLKKLKSIETERDEWQEKYNSIQAIKITWEIQESEYQSQIAELKMNTQQGVQMLREELQKEKSLNDELRSERVLILRQNELRLFDLETSNVENIKALTDKEHELNQYKALLNQTGGVKEYQSLARDYEILKQDYTNITQQVESQKETILQYEKRVRQLDSELKISHIKAEDDRIRVNELMAISDAKIIELQSIIQQQHNNSSSNGGSNDNHSNTSTDENNSSNNNNNNNNNNTKMALLMEQIQSLSKQLMKKQDMTTDLQTEKSVLKSRVMDLMARCTYAEQELSRLRDIEDGNVDDEEENNDEESNNSNSSYNDTADGDGGGGGGRGLVHRNATTFGESATNTPLKTTGANSASSSSGFSYSNDKYRNAGNANNSTIGKGRKGKIMTDLALLGVRASPSIVKAMNTIDSFTLVTGRVLHNHSILRIFFLFYLLVLHLWVIFILGVHVHSIDIQSNNGPI